MAEMELFDRSNTSETLKMMAAARFVQLIAGQDCATPSVLC